MPNVRVDMGSALKKGVYRHFKGEDKEYLVLGEAIHSETLEPMVLYQALYGERQTYVRPKRMFLEEVDCPEYAYNGPRFVFVRDAA